MAATKCSACGHDTFVVGANGGGQCTRCGYASGESNRCPHCGAVARIEGSGENAVCAVCGGPRINGNFGGETAANALKEKKKALSNARLASVATVVQATFAAIATLIGLAIMPASLVGKLIVFLIAATPILLAMRSRSRATKAREVAKNAGDRAWQAAAEDAAVHSKSGITVNALAKTLGIEQPQAEKLLTSLAVNDRTRIDVGDDAEVRYSVAPENLVRVGDPLTSERDDLADQFEALEAQEEEEKKKAAMKEPAR
jgi:hypothetical protein